MLLKQIYTMNKKNTARRECPSFNKASRKRYLRNVLCEMKSEITDSQNLFDIVFKFNDMAHGFECEFSIVPRKNTDVRDPDVVLLHGGVKFFIEDMLGYMFSNKVEVDWSTNERTLRTKFTIKSH